MKTLLPPGWPQAKGYSHGVMARGQMVFVSGQV
jgi:enamine deaminase RidA (YjgF/YER057c/UK114 family)